MSTPSFAFPQSLADKYRPRTIAEFAGLEKPKKILRKFAANPYPSAWLFVGPPLQVEYGGDYRTQKSVQPFVAEILTPLNGGLLNPQSTMLVSEFVERIYLSEYVDKHLRAATKKQYRDIWENHLRAPRGQANASWF